MFTIPYLNSYSILILIEFNILSFFTSETDTLFTVID